MTNFYNVEATKAQLRAARASITPDMLKTKASEIAHRHFEATLSMNEAVWHETNRGVAVTDMIEALAMMFAEVTGNVVLGIPGKLQQQAAHNFACVEFSRCLMACVTGHGAEKLETTTVSEVGGRA